MDLKTRGHGLLAILLVCGIAGCGTVAVRWHGGSVDRLRPPEIGPPNDWSFSNLLFFTHLGTTVSTTASLVPRDM